MDRNGSRWIEMDQKMPKMDQNGSKMGWICSIWIKIDRNGPKWVEIGQNRSKWAKMGQKGSKQVYLGQNRSDRFNGSEEVKIGHTG